MKQWTGAFRVTSAPLANVRNRAIEVDDTIDSVNKVVVEAVRGFGPRGMQLDLVPRPDGSGVFPCSPAC